MKNQGKQPTNKGANIKNSQGKGKGIAPATKGGANYRNSQKGGASVGKQTGVSGPAKIAGPAKRGINKLNKAPIVGVTPKRGPAKMARNSVTTADTKRLRTANLLGMPKTGGGGFKNFIGGK